MFATYKLINAYFWKTIYGPLISFLFPVILLLVLGNIFRIQYVYPGIISMSMLFIGMLSLPLSIMELKQSSLFKYIGSSPVKPIKFTLVVIGFYVFIAIISSIIVLITTMIAFRGSVFPGTGFRNGILGGIFSLVGSMSFFVASALHLVFVISFGLLISTISKTPQQALTIGLMILIPSIFLSGMIISVDIIGQSVALNWISRLNPFRYTTGNIVIASTPKNQIGDMFQTLTISEMELIFKVKGDNSSGLGTIKTNDDKTFSHIVFNGKIGDKGKFANNIIIKNMDDIVRVKKKFGLDFYGDKGFLRDEALFKLTFDKAIETESMTSDNNIFNWTNSWSVRRVPSVSTVKTFIIEYFKATTGGNSGFDKLIPISKKILEGEFDWLNIFMKQTNGLYTAVERALNIIVPLLTSSWMIWYITKNFKWTIK